MPCNSKNIICKSKKHRSLIKNSEQHLHDLSMYIYLHSEGQGQVELPCKSDIMGDDIKWVLKL